MAVTHLAKSLRFGVLLKTESREVNAGPEYFRFGQNTDTPYTVNFHLHVWITVWVAQVGQMRAPRGIFGISLHNHGILIESVCKGERSFGFLPGVQVVWLLTAKPVGEGSPDVCRGLVSTPDSHAIGTSYWEQ